MAVSRWTLIGLGALGVVNLVRGIIHVFLPDGGAGTIAGFDLSQERETILFLFVAVGAGQIGAGLIDFAVALKWRAFALPLLAIETFRAVLFTLVTQLWKRAPIDVPGEKFVTFLALVLGGLLVWELARTRSRAST